MVHELVSQFRKHKVALALSVLTLILGSSALASSAMPVKAYAAACDRVNIIYCGLDGSGAGSYTTSFQNAYQNGSNAGHDDLKAIFRWAGATNASVASMNSTNTKVGTLYRNGDIKVDGKVVGKDAWVAARFGDSKPGFVQISPGVWARKTTTSLEHDTYKVIVHFGADGNADFAVMVDCGNAVKFTPVQQPKPVQPKLECTSLTQVPTGQPMTYSFTASANAVATTIQSYVFTFSSNASATTTETVNNSANNVTLTHTFSQHDTTYTVSVAIQGISSSGAPITAAACTVNITTPKVQECKPGVPVGDSRCNECRPGVPMGSPECTPQPQPQVQGATTTRLVDTSPGSVALAGLLVAIIAFVGRLLYLRHKFGA